MFKYNQFPILRLQAYNNEGLLHRKTLCQKSSTPYLQTPTYSLTQIIDMQTSQHLTLKKIKKSKNLCKESTLSEISNQSRFKNNPNFIQIQEVYEDHENIYILMEDNGTSLQELLDIRGCLFQREIQYIFCQLVDVLQVLRMWNVFHGAISLKNLFVKGKDMKIKLSGFNHSINMQKTKIQPHPNLYAETQLSPYTAPELLDNTIQSPLTYYAGDIWAVGVVLYTLLVGEEPFTNHDKQKNLITPSIMKLKNLMYQFPAAQLFMESNGDKKKRVKNSHKKGSLSPVWKQLIKRIFSPRQQRITLQQLIKHPLNNITQSKFTQLNCKQAPRICNHTLSIEDETLAMIRFSSELPKSLNSKCSTTTDKLRLQFCALNHSQLIPIPSCVMKVVTQQKPLLCLGQVTTNILSLILQQQKQSISLPIISRHPQYIERYCYIKKANCVGYVFDNNIGVVFEDGSYALGKNQNDFKYYTNQGLTMDDVLALYVQLYNNFYRTTTDNNRQIQIDQINESSNQNINLQTGCASTNSNQNSSSSGSKGSSKALGKNSNSNKSSEAVISQKDYSINKLKKSKMLEGSSFNMKKQTLSRQISINQAMLSPSSVTNQYSFIKFGESFVSGSLGPFRQLNKDKGRFKTNQLQEYPIPSQKYEIYKYYIEFFGDRVLDSKKGVSVLGFWRLNCGIVFLFSTGAWQVNLNQGIETNSSLNDSSTTILTYQSQQKKRSRKQENECAIVIDQYGLAWWLQPHGNSNSYNKDANNGESVFDQLLNGFNVRRSQSVRMEKLGGQMSINDGYNTLAVKIARKAVAEIKNAYMREFQDIMEPYKYAYS